MDEQTQFYYTMYPYVLKAMQQEGVDTAWASITTPQMMMEATRIQNNPTPQFVPKYNYGTKAEGGFLQPRDAWDRLSIAEQAAMMKAAVSEGIYDLSEIRKRYNEFAEGGPITDEEYIATMEKVAEDNYQKWGFNTPDEALVHALNDNTYNYRGYYDKYPQSAANADTHWPDEFKTVYHPTFSNESIYSGQKSQYNPHGLIGGFWIDESFFPQAWQMHQQQNVFADGGIHIKPSHRGRLTELKKRTGKTEAELYRTGSAATRKMITFARNARKWKHDLG